MATPLLLPEDVAAELGVTVATLKDWRYKGTGPAFVKLNRAVRYEPDAVKAYRAALTPTSNVTDIRTKKSA